MNDTLKELLIQKADEIWPSVIKNRRYLHTHPELSFMEFDTASYIRNQLQDLQVPWQAMATTGTVAILKGDLPNQQVIALRADIDALPIIEQNQFEYASTHEGVMHACGHDAHTSSLLGVIAILHSIKHLWGGTIKFIFQPGEEKLPGGASLMIAEGVLDKPKPSYIIGQHVMPSLACGKIAIRKGKFMASMDEVLLKIKGKGGHGAQPHLNVDPVLIASHIIIALQQVVSRMAFPGHPTVLSFGKVIANGAINVIPDEVHVEGTFRAMDETWRNEAHIKIKQIARGIAESMGAACEVTIHTGYPHLINHEELSNKIESISKDYLGKQNVLDQDIWMAAEDFAYYSQVANGCFYLLGVGNPEKNINAALHTSRFDLDEDALKISTGLMAYIACKLLEEPPF